MSQFRLPPYAGRPNRFGRTRKLDCERPGDQESVRDRHGESQLDPASQPVHRRQQQIYQNPNAPFINSLVNGTASELINGSAVNISKQVSYATAYHNVLATASGHNPGWWVSLNIHRLALTGHSISRYSACGN